MVFRCGRIELLLIKTRIPRNEPRLGWLGFWPLESGALGGWGALRTGKHGAQTDRRKILVVSSPTATGWLNEVETHTVENMHGELAPSVVAANPQKS